MSVEDRVEWRARMLSIGMMRSRPAVREYRDGAVKVKEVTDEAGNVLTWRSDKEAAGVEIRPKTVTLAGGRTYTHQESE